MIGFLLYALHVVLCLFLILVVLLQQGKGADLSVFGGGTTMTAFGARSATNLLHRLTVGAFVGFVLTTLVIAYREGNSRGDTVMKDTPAAATAPATTAPATEPATEPAAAPATGTTEPVAAPPAAVESAPAVTPEAAPTPPPANP